MNTRLYHCTKAENLKNILKTGAFYPSFCLEESNFMRINIPFAFAMVSFADLMDVEKEDHMKTFKSNSYIVMKKNWAINNALSNVIYYNKESIVSRIIRQISNETTQKIYKINEKESEIKDTLKYMGLLYAFMKQYIGYYWDKNNNCWSKKETLFFKEREWRYIPIVQNKEAFYITEEEFKDKEFRKGKEQELIKNGYTLKFKWDDIEEISCPHIFKDNLITLLMRTYNLEKKEIITKLQTHNQ